MEIIKCNKCSIDFKVFKKGSKKYYESGQLAPQRRCLTCLRRVQRQTRKKEWSKRYEKTKEGFLVRLYRNMKSRIEGIQKIKRHLYSDKEILGKSEFYSWAKSCQEFHYLYDNWKESNYSRKLTPSVDRINSSKGYTLDNMEWVTFSENCRRGASGTPALSDDSLL